MAQAQRRASAIRATPQPSVSGTERLWVQAQVAPHAELSADQECREIVLDWLQQSFEDRLPRKALRHRPFSHREGDAVVPGRAGSGRGAGSVGSSGRSQLGTRPAAGDGGHGRERGRRGHRARDRGARPLRGSPGGRERVPADLVAEIGGRVPPPAGGSKVRPRPDPAGNGRRHERIPADARRSGPRHALRRGLDSAGGTEPGYAGATLAGAGPCSRGPCRRVGPAARDDLPPERHGDEAAVRVPGGVAILPSPDSTTPRIGPVTRWSSGTV